MDHPTLAGLLLPDYQDATFTAGGPCGRESKLSGETVDAFLEILTP